jgi:MoaD family protein
LRGRDRIPGRTVSMKITVKFLAYFRDIFEAKERDIGLPDEASLGDLLELLGDSSKRRTEILAGSDQIHPQVIIMINGTPAQSLGGLNARLKDGDLVAVFPFLGGG